MRKKHFTVNKKQVVKMGAVVSLIVCMALQAAGCSAAGTSGKESTEAAAMAESSGESTEAATMAESSKESTEAAGTMDKTAAAADETSAPKGDTAEGAAKSADGSSVTGVSAAGEAQGEGDSGTEAKPGAALKEGNKAPDFTATLLDGTTVKLSDLKGKPVLINFWATWCGPCVGEMPAFQRLEKDYGDKIGLIAVNAGEDTDTVKDFITSNNYTFPVALDENYEIASLYPTNGIPYTVVVDANGKITHVSTGAMDADTMYQRYKEALGL